MKKTWYFFVCVVLASIASIAPAKAQIPVQMTRTLVPAGTTTYGYIQYLPSGWTSRTDWPLIIYLHGSGETGAGTTVTLPAVEGQGVAFEIAKHGRKVPAVVLALQAPSAWNAANIDQVVNYAITNYRVSSDRVCITGYDSGGTGAMNYLNNYPNKVAAVAPVCGNEALTMSNAYTVVAANTPIWAFHAINDTVAPADASNPNGPWTTFTRLAAARGATSYGALDGYTNTGTPRTGYTGSDGKRYAWDFEEMNFLKNGQPFSAQQFWTVFPTGDHWMWNQVFESNKLYDWMIGKSRATSQPGQRILVTPTTGLSYGFIAYLPEDYSSRTNWPVIITLHGTSERGDSTTNISTGLPKVEAKGIPNEIQNKGRKIPAVVIAPQAPTSVSLWAPAKVDEVIVYANGHFGIDSKRVILTGFDMGGGGTWDYVNANLSKLAAAMPICPLADGAGHGELDFTVAQSVIDSNFPLWVASARSDTTAPEVYVWNSFNRLLVKRTGNNGPTGVGSLERYPTGTTNLLTGYYCGNVSNYMFDVLGEEYKRHGEVISPRQIWTVYTGSSHDLWTPVYADNKVYDWMLLQSK